MTVAGPSFFRKLTTATDWKTGLVIPALAVFTALVIGGVIIMLTGYSLAETLEAYRALLQGSVGSLRAISQTLTEATPLIFTGLAVALAFRAGLFNIGGEGQLLMGGMLAVLAGFTFTGLPLIIHLPLAIVCGAIGGAIWGFIPGLLKAKTGAHEVIVTIMLNYIAYRLVDYFLKTTLFQREGRNDPISKTVEESAQLPALLAWLDPAMKVHLGLFLALGAAGVHLVAALPHQHRLRVPCGRGQPERRPVRGHVGHEGLHPRDDDLRRPRRPGRARARCSACSTGRVPASPPASASTASPSRCWAAPTRSAWSLRRCSSAA